VAIVNHGRCCNSSGADAGGNVMTNCNDDALKGYKFDESKYITGVRSLYADGFKAGQESKDELLHECLGAIIWMTGSNDFAEGGQAREGYNNLVKPLLNKLMEALDDTNS